MCCCADLVKAQPWREGLLFKTKGLWGAEPGKRVRSAWRGACVKFGAWCRGRVREGLGKKTGQGTMGRGQGREKREESREKREKQREERREKREGDKVKDRLDD